MTSSSQKNSMFTLGREYSRREIHTHLGGSIVSCLPTRNGAIVAACLDKKFSPRAPEVVLCGRGARTSSISALFAQQQNTIPVFVKSASNRWQYRGHFLVTQTFSPDTPGNRFESFIIGSGRSVSSVSHVVVLKRSEKAECEPPSPRRGLTSSSTSRPGPGFVLDPHAGLRTPRGSTRRRARTPR